MDRPNAIADETVPALPRGVKFREDKARSRFVLLGPERIFEADAIATEILKRVDGKASFKAILTDLTQTFTADEATIRPDVEAFLTDLANKQMVSL
ncbi:pyrroloquinoline quinone biosynthesis peptide chaperone PqqD [Jiella sp. MQZ9-1]|uniref:Pyrroloquinoline quinone biosynthesis peptide chaperone PqqD n=1 Tax=Jiella flava TaxID=2816857 RepID=A0A939G346_9HYPH|nr:pyrroloquinoline quinone biosynthesis peptide chaperone PqqD [Jiella flava]MBO0664199.1 pyrroloquinoline quinone biosynthesis peptide chaperone PqqD [Jiella flava]MCD2472846.1 pyrroloquinoline quinone biosynthesis peptide chaperone PqqD [Jiella flava]